MFKTVCKAAALAAMAGTVMGDSKPSRRDELAARKAALAEEMAALESEMALAPAAPAADAHGPRHSDNTLHAVVLAPAATAAPAAIAEADGAEVELAESAAVAEAFPEPEGAAPTELELLRQQIAELEAKAEMDRLKKQLAELKTATPGEAEAAPAPSPAPKTVVADAEPAPPLPAAEAEATPPAPSPAPKSAVADAEPAPALPAEEAAPVEAAEPKPDEAPAPRDEDPVEPEATAPPFVGPANNLEASSAEEQKEEPAPAADGRLEQLRALRNGEPNKARSERRAANAKARQDRAARKAQPGPTVPPRDTAMGSEEQQIERMQTIADDRAEARRKRAERLRSLRSLRNGGHGDMPAGFDPESGLPTEDAEAGPGIGSVLGFSAVVLAMLGVGAYGLKSKMAGSRVRRDSFASNSSRSSMGGVATQLVASVQNVTGLTSRRNNRISLGV